jgi:fructose-1-phosphate kinase PfkB-like protein
MPSVDKITILELTPCADSLLRMERNDDEGYLAADESTITLRAGARLRPSIAGTYAGGKATNVARVLDRLLGPDDKVEVEHIVFLADSVEGRYIQELTRGTLNRVRTRPVIVKSNSRFCINLSDPGASAETRVEFDISPRITWDPDAVKIALKIAHELSTDLLLLAGNPPVIDPEGQPAWDLPSKIIEAAGSRARAISIDLQKDALALCLAAPRQPDVIKLNQQEYASIDRTRWSSYQNLLIVTDPRGCTVWECGPRSGTRIEQVRGLPVFSTVGAGDAAHAGFTVARWVWGWSAVEAARYGQAAAAAAVTSAESTRGITKAAVDDHFSRIVAPTD